VHLGAPDLVFIRGHLDIAGDERLRTVCVMGDLDGPVDHEMKIIEDGVR